MTHSTLRLLLLALSTSTLACGGSGSSADTSPTTVTFGVPEVLTCSNGSRGVNVVQGDFNGDHRPDLAGCLADDTVDVFLNQGDGTFSAPRAVSISRASTSYDDSLANDMLEVHDINGDGLADLVRLSATQNSPVDVEIALSNGDGTFAKEFAQPTYPYACDVDDFSLDGYADAICYEQGTLTVKHMVSDGSAQTAFTLATPAFPQIGDVNGDGKLDLVYAIGSTIGVQLGSGGSSFAAVQIVLEATNTVDNVQFADIDGDGLVDLIARTGTSDSGWTDWLVHNKGALAFEVWSQVRVPDNVDETYCDATGDGRVDIVLTQAAQILIMVGQGDGTFDSTAVLVTGPWSIARNPLFIDLTGGGKPDIVVGDTAVSVLLRQ